MANGKAGRPRGNNYEKNRLNRIPKEYREKIVSGKATPVNADDPAKMPVEVFRKSAFYDPARQAVSQAIDINNRMFEILNSAKDRKHPLYNDESLIMYNMGVQLRPIFRITTDDLRGISYSSSLIGAIHQIVSDDCSMYAKYQEDPGFGIKLKLKDQRPTPEQIKYFEELAGIFLIMGDKTVSDWRERDRMGEVLEMATRDSLAIDAVAYLRTYNRSGKLCDIRYLDPGSIYRVDPRKGFRGDLKITHVQMIQNQVTEVFEAGRIIYRHKNNLSDVRMRGFGYSPIESCITEIMAMVNSIKWNADRFNHRNPPRAIITTKNQITKTDQERLELQWENQFYGARPNFRLPMMFGVGDMQVHNLDIEDDFAFDKLLQMTASLIIARHGMDPAQIGLKLTQSNALSEASMDGRQHFSRDRMHGSMMSFHEDCLNEIYDPDMETLEKLSFIGVKTNDESKKADLHEKHFRTYRNLDSILKENDMPTMKDQAEKALKDGIINEEEAKKYSKIGLLIGNQYASQEIAKIFTSDPQNGMPGQDIPPTPQNESEEQELPWGDEDFIGGENETESVHPDPEQSVASRAIAEHKNN
ncbi:MAG: phage portal protein [Leptospiraceae bacterium]|nr:phage portal protein [Leptospiraceae bacterium]